MKLSDPIFHNETAARKHLEALRWPDGAICPSCNGKESVKALGGKSMGEGWYHCGECREKFTVRVGTVFERSKIPLHKWLLGFRLMASSKKGISAHQLHRTLDITYKSAWFMAHRIREAMTPLSYKTPMGGSGKIVEADETYIGGKDSNKHLSKRKPYRGPVADKAPVVSLVERDGTVRSFHLPTVTSKTLAPILQYHVSRKSFFVTDDHSIYPAVGKDFTAHETVNHSAKEYVRDKVWHTNSAENYFSILKRGITGTYHHVSQQHLKRYVGEFDFRYNTRKVSDGERADIALKGSEGKRLTYQEAGRFQEDKIGF